MIAQEQVGREVWRLEWLAKQEKYQHSHYIRYIRDRNRRNRNAQVLTVGSQGSGKTFHNLAVCLLLDPTFTIDQVTFSPVELLRLVTSERLRPGSCVLLEEAGIQAPSASWQSKEVKLFSQFFETARRLGINFFLNAPSRDNIAKSIRNLMHIEASPMMINERMKIVKCRAYLLQPNALRGKVYIHKLQKKTPEGRVPIKCWTAPAPPEEFIKQYAAKRNEFQRTLNSELLVEFLTLENKSAGQKRLAVCKDCNRVFRSEFFSEQAPPRKCSSCSSKKTEWYKEPVVHDAIVAGSESVMQDGK